ncbi:HWE histidine kinase domain-containing protein [Caulobacter segnis]|uniref:HWE histidine kinase domain-containing protein n=1 Tax=Caulobacter segnis TaxID=88688 RepID=UPI001CBC1524|nr:HWE histidine kinase domain-containing protein [Caulobacter segnis]UAL10520.1 GAF domain-containing protein [Caulobacter segnis]
MSELAPMSGFEVDLTNCDREPIHILGSVQPFGVLLAVNSDWVVVHASTTSLRYLGVAAADLLGRPLTQVMSGHAIHNIRGRLQVMRGADAVERMFGQPLVDGGEDFDLALHYSGRLLIIEGEPSHPDTLIEPASAVRSMTTRIAARPTFEEFCHEAARQVRALTEFDRVMVYRFAHDGAGEVIAESVRPGIGSFLGQRYPASDIPVQARALYERSWLRIIADVDAEISPIIPQVSPSGEPVDLSMSMLRAVSPIHIEYLRNMGVAASLSISILRDGKLWGLFACHHYAPKHISYERRTAAELFGQLFSLNLESREREIETRRMAEARNLHDRMMNAVVKANAGADSLSPYLDDLCRLVSCDGLALWLEGRLTLRDSTPDASDVHTLVRVLRDKDTHSVFATNDISALLPSAAAWSEKAAGMMAVPLSRAPRDYLIFFRKEEAKTVVWAGKPAKLVQVGPLGDRLTPRKSFEAWEETVRGQSRPWTTVERSLAESMRASLLEIVFRLTDLADEERQRANQRQELLIAELNHRVRNILGLIRGLISQSRAGVSSVEEFAEVVGGRVQALARAHDQITRHQWGPGALSDLITAEAEAYLSTKAERVKLNGAPTALAPDAFSILSLVIHELMTNSAKYGALCDQRGQVTIDWSRDAKGDLIIDWREKDGPPVKAPTRRGFGSTIIEHSIPHDLNGEVALDYRPEGFQARIRIPGRYVTTEGVTAAVTQPRRTDTPVRAPETMLVLEDNMIIALDLEDMLTRLGVKQVTVASSVGQAMDALAEALPPFAILDVNLGQETSFPVAEALQAAGVPFAFGTGFGDSAAFPDRFRDAPVLQKPYSAESVAALF